MNKNEPDGAKVITQNFVNAIVKNEPLIVAGAEGVKGLEIGNAMLMSGLTREPVDLPLDGDAFDEFLESLKKKYAGRKTLAAEKAGVSSTDMSSSFGKV